MANSLKEIEVQAQAIYNECKQGHITRGQMLQDIYGLCRVYPYFVKQNKADTQAVMAEREAARIIHAMDNGTDFQATNRPKGPYGLINRAARRFVYTGQPYSVRLGELNALDPTAWTWEKDVQDNLTGFTTYNPVYEHANHPYYHLVKSRKSHEYDPTRKPPIATHAGICGVDTLALLWIPKDGEVYRPCPKCQDALNRVTNYVGEQVAEPVITE